MADLSKTIQVIFETILNNAGIKALSDQVKMLGDESKTAGQKVGSGFSEDVGKGLGDFKRGMMEAMGTAEALRMAIAFIGDSIKSALAEEKINKQFVQNLMALGGVTEQVAQQTLAWTEQLEVTSTISKEQLTPVLQNLVAITGDVATAQQLTAAAAGAASRGIGDFSRNATTLQMALEKGVIRGHDAFAVKLREAYKETGNMTTAVAKLTAAYGDGGEAVQDNATQVERQKIAWDNAKEAMGGMFTTLVVQLLPGIKIAATGIAGLVGVVKLIISGFVAWGKQIGAVGGLIANFLSGNFKGGWEVFKEQSAEAKDQFMADFTEVGDMITSVGAAFDATTGKLQTPGGPLAGGKGKGRGAGGEGGEGGAKGKPQLFGPSIDEWEKYQEELRERSMLTAELMAQDEEDLLERKLEIQRRWLEEFHGSENERLKLQLSIKKDEEALASASANRRAAAEKARFAGLRRDSRAWLLEEKKMAEEELAIAKKKNAGIAAAEKKLTGIKKALLKQQAAAAKMVARQGLALARGAFGESKGLAIAEATMNTYEGAVVAFRAGVEAMASTGPGAIAAPVVGAAFAALAVATGIKNIQEIQKADPSQGSGFDDPKNDMVAYIGGQRWAKDYARHWTNGINAGMGDVNAGMTAGGAKGPNYTYNIDRPGQVVSNRSISVGAMPLVDTGRSEVIRDLSVALKAVENLDSDRNQT